MKYLLLPILFIFCKPLSAQETDTLREFSMRHGDTVYQMKKYFMCIYLEGTNRSQDSATVAAIQQGHLQHIFTMAKQGVVCMAGPFGDETVKKGILVFNVATRDETEKWIKSDPAVKAGRLTYEIHPWWAAKGSVLK